MTAKVVDETTRGVIRHRIDREIATGQIAIDAIEELDVIRMPPVTIGAVSSVCRDLEGFVIDDDGHGTVLDAGIDRLEACISSCGLDLLGLGRGGDIPIVGNAAHESIAHAPAHDIRLVARRFEQVENGLSALWNLDVHEDMVHLITRVLVAERVSRCPTSRSSEIARRSCEDCLSAPLLHTSSAAVSRFRSFGCESLASDTRSATVSPSTMRSGASG